MRENNNRTIGAEEMTTQPAAATKYRRAFLVTLFFCIALAMIAGGLWWRLHTAPAMMSMPASAMGSMAQPDAQAMPASGESTAQAQEPPRAPIQLSPQRLQSIGVSIGTVESKQVNDEIRFYGNVQPDERRLAHVQTRFSGWIRKVYADATGDFVREGQPLFTIYSPDLVTTEREYLLAKKNAAALQQSPVNGVAAGAASMLEAAKARLQQWEIPPSEIAKLDETGEVITELTFNSPVSGFIMERMALPNTYVMPETRLYTIADLFDVWVYAQVFQNDAGKITPGDRADVTVDAYPGRVFAGHVDYLLPQLDPMTRTLPVRLIFPNPELELRLGMFVNVRVKLSLGRQLVVPDSAVLHSGTRNLIFAYLGDGNIEPREVEVGAHVGSQYVITKGVKAGQRIVTSANFLIDSEAQLQAAAGAFVPPPPGAGAAAAVNLRPSETSMQVELATEPSPPHRGNNTFRVKVTDASGAPVTGAQVSVRSFMAAMPAMGMAAMSGQGTLADKGGGLYEGRITLDSGGTWQITVTVTKNGQVVGTKQVSMIAEGEMAR